MNKAEHQTPLWYHETFTVYNEDDILVECPAKVRDTFAIMQAKF